MQSLQSFEIRFGRADFYCAIGFQPFLGIHFEPISEHISVPLPRLNAETTSANLDTGKSITYSTADNTRSARVTLKLLDKNDVGEFSHIGTGNFNLRDGHFANSVEFVSVYDRTFELGTIDVCAIVKIKQDNYNPLKIKRKDKKYLNRKKGIKPKTRPKTAPAATLAKSLIDTSKILKESKFLARNYEASCMEDIGAISNPPALYYKSPKAIASLGWKSTEIIDKLKNGTPLTKVKVFHEEKDRRSSTILSMYDFETDQKDCPLVTQIVKEINILNTKHHRAKSARSVVETNQAISNLKNFNKTNQASEAPVFEYKFKECPNYEDSEHSMGPVITRRSSQLNVSHSRTSIGLVSSNSRLRQNVNSGTYDRYGRPTLKPVFSDRNLPIFSRSISTCSIEKDSPEKRATYFQNLEEDEPIEKEQKCIETQTFSATNNSLKQQTVLSIDILGRNLRGPTPAPSPSPRSRTNHSALTSVHISLPSIASETATSLSRNSNYSDDFTDGKNTDEETEISEDFEKTRSESFKMMPQRSKSPTLTRPDNSRRNRLTH